MTPRKSSMDARLIREAYRIAPATLAASLLLSLLSGIGIVLQALFLSHVIAQVFLQHSTLEDVAPQLLALGIVVVARAGIAYLDSNTAASLAIQVKNRFREQWVTKFALLGPAYLRTERSGELVLTATEGIEKLDHYFRDYLPGVFAVLFQPVLILLVVLPRDTLTFFVLLVTAPLIPFFMALIGMAAGLLAKRQFLEMRFLGAHFLDVMQGLTTLKLFNRSQYQVETIRRITTRFREATMRVLRVAFLSAFTLEMLATLSVAIVAVEIGVRLLYGGISFEQALFLLVIAPEFYLPLRALGAKFHNATGGKASAERLFEVLDTTTLESAATTAGEPVPDRLDIRFEGVSVAYDNGSRQALANVSFEVKPGEHVALIGASGSGKTTLTSLLLRFMAPDTGRITVGEHDLSRIAVDPWRANIGWVAQAPYLFNITVAENIRFSRPDASDQDVIAAAQVAGAHAFIQQLPHGYQTVCGERGLRLSGGQAQRIALARALLRNAPLYILDEPTSQLDPTSEAEIMQALKTRLDGHTLLLITHRLSAATYADRILLLDNGRIVEQGTPAALMAAGGRYAQLVRAEGDSR